MAADSQNSPRKLRLNPFVFPSDTDLRFVLLVVSVLGASLFVYNWLYYDFFASQFMETLRRCIASSPAVHRSTGAGAAADSLAAFDQKAAQSQAIERCIEPVERAQFLWIFCGVVLVLVVAAGIYWAIPVLKIRRDKLVPLTDERAPGVGAYLAELCHEAELSHPPTFLVNPHNHSASGLAFGRRRQRYVSLNVGLLVRFYADRPAFRAVVLHELAHLRNADVDKTYFSVAVGMAFAIVALVPFATSLVRYLIGAGEPGGPSLVFGVTWRVIALGALVYLTLAAVLRVREVYADVRASAWDGPSGALWRALSTQQRPDGGRWRVLLRFHPDPEQRRRAITETDGLFRLGFWDAFATGVTAMAAAPMFDFVLNLLIPSRLELWSSTVTALLVAPLAVGVIGLGAWRGAFAALARGEASRGARGLGLGLGLGIVAGAALSLDSAITGLSLEGESGIASMRSTIVSLAINVVLATVLLVGLFYFLRWISVGASAWLEVITTRRSLRLIVSLGLIMAGLISTVWLSPLLWLFLTASTLPLESSTVLADLTTAPLTASLALANYLFLSPLTLAVFVGLWIFPLAARLGSGRTASVSATSWAFLDPSTQPLTLRHRGQFRLSQGLVAGMVGGLAYCVLLLIAQFWWNSVPETVRSTDQAKISFFVGQVALAVLVQVSTAIIVTAKVRWLGVLHGLFAAFVAGCLMALGTLGLNLAFGGTIDASFAWTTLALVINGGAVLSLPLSGGVATMASWARRARPK
jgi:hypothetical protein